MCRKSHIKKRSLNFTVCAEGSLGFRRFPWGPDGCRCEPPWIPEAKDYEKSRKKLLMVKFELHFFVKGFLCIFNAFESALEAFQSVFMF